MSIDVLCSCGKRLRAKDQAAGKVARCPACGDAIAIPSKRPPDLPAPRSVKNAKTEGQSRRLPILWISVGLLCSMMLSAAVLEDRRIKTSRANELVGTKVLDAKKAADNQQWDEAVELLQQALSTPRASELNEAKLLLVKVVQSKANKVVNDKIQAARQEMDHQQWDKAIALLQEATAVQGSSMVEDAKHLLALANGAKSRLEAEAQSRATEEQKVTRATSELPIPVGEMRRWEAHDDMMTAAAFSPDGTLLDSGDYAPFGASYLSLFPR